MKEPKYDTVKSGLKPESAMPGWWIVARKELIELWFGGR